MVMATMHKCTEMYYFHSQMSYTCGQIFYRSNQKHMSNANLCLPLIHTPHTQRNFKQGFRSHAGLPRRLSVFDGIGSVVALMR